MDGAPQQKDEDCHFCHCKEIACEGKEEVEPRPLLGTIKPMKKTVDPRRDRAKKIVRVLARQYPDAHCALHYKSPLQLLIATILSAQCTDVRVNMVTPALFQRYPDLESYA